MTLGGSQLLGEEAKVVSHCQARRASCSQLPQTCDPWKSRANWKILDRQSERHCHSRRRGHCVASKHAGLRGLWLQEALVDGKPELEKVDTATNPADVCTKALPGDRIRELCRLARVYVCCSEEITSDDPNEWYLSRLDEL